MEPWSPGDHFAGRQRDDRLFFEIHGPVLRIAAAQQEQCAGMAGGTGPEQLGFGLDEQVCQLGPVIIVAIDEESCFSSRLDIANAPKSRGSRTLGFLIQSRVEALVISGVADRHSMGMTLGIDGCQMRHDLPRRRLFQFRSTRFFCLPRCPVSVMRLRFRGRASKVS